MLWLALLAGNILIFTMLLVMGYSVAYFGVLAPDRVVKYRLIRFLFRGPLLAITIAAAVAVLIRIEQFLGLPSETITILAIVFFIVLFQIVRGSLQPILDVLLFQQDRSELDYIRSLSDRLLTSTDLQQFLENVLTAVADLLRVPARVSRVTRSGWAVAGADACRRDRVVWHGAGRDARDARFRPLSRAPSVSTAFGRGRLRARSNEDLLGALAVAARSSEPDFSEAETKRLQTLITQAAIALEDRRLQKEVFAAVERIMPEIDVLQRQRGEVRYTDSPTQPSPDATVTADPEFPNWVKDALSHYWGGPKLTASPLVEDADCGASVAGKSRRCAQGAARGAGGSDRAAAPRWRAQLHRCRVGAVQHSGTAFHPGAQSARHCRAPGDERKRSVSQAEDRGGSRGRVAVQDGRARGDGSGQWRAKRRPRHRAQSIWLNFEFLCRISPRRSYRRGSQGAWHG